MYHCRFVCSQVTFVKLSESSPHVDLAILGRADHYLGNLICRTEREATPQEDALDMVNSAAVAFLDAYLKQSAEALAFLAGEQLAETTGKFATLERR